MKTTAGVTIVAPSAVRGSQANSRLAKPIAVDVAGCLAVERASKAAGPSRKVLVDFQTRRDPLFREAAQRVRRGDIGPAVLGKVFYHAGRHAPVARRHGHGSPAKLGVRQSALGRHLRRAEHPGDRRGELVLAIAPSERAAQRRAEGPRRRRRLLGSLRRDLCLSGRRGGRLQLSTIHKGASTTCASVCTGRAVLWIPPMTVRRARPKRARASSQGTRSRPP